MFNIQSHYTHIRYWAANKKLDHFNQPDHLFPLSYIYLYPTYLRLAHRSGIIISRIYLKVVCLEAGKRPSWQTDFLNDEWEMFNRTAWLDMRPMAANVTVGAAENPTLTIVTLAIRQAEYITEQMASGNL